MMRMKKTLIIIILLMGVVTTSAQSCAEIYKLEQYRVEVGTKLQRDYPMADYSTSRIDANVMGPRLTKILENICENYQQCTCLLFRVVRWKD